MHYSIRYNIALLLVIVTMTIGTNYELKVSGNAGISLEHILILVGLIVVAAKAKINISQSFSIIIALGCILYSIAQIQLTFASLHLVSFFILASQFFIYRYLKSDDIIKLIYVTVILLFVQVSFFQNTGGAWDEWDYIVLPGFGFINRLSILGFVSNSLAMMCLPLIIFLLYEKNRIFGQTIIIGLLSVILLLTFSRVGLLSLLIIFVIKFKFKFIFPILALTSVVLINDFSRYLEIIDLVVIRGGILGNPRVAMWIENFSEMQGLNFLIGKGIMFSPSDNTFVSLFTGGGILLAIGVPLTFLGFASFAISKSAPILSLVVIALLSLMTFDVFSQRKLIFTFCLVASYFYVRKKENIDP